MRYTALGTDPAFQKRLDPDPFKAYIFWGSEKSYFNLFGISDQVILFFEDKI